MSLVYELIGRLVVRTLWWRFQREVRIAGGMLAALVVVAGSWPPGAKPPEG